MKQDMSAGSELALKFAEGDRNAFSTIYDELMPALSLFAQRYVGNDEEAIDIAQNNFIQLWNSRERFTTYDHIRAFLWHNTKNACINYKVRKTVQHKAVKELAFLGKQEETECQMYEVKAEFLFQMLLEQVELLPDACRKAFKLTYYDKLPSNEIAFQMGITIKTVHSHLRNARDLLRTRMGHHQFEMAVAVLLMADHAIHVQHIA